MTRMLKPLAFLVAATLPILAHAAPDDARLEQPLVSEAVVEAPAGARDLQLLQGPAFRHHQEGESPIVALGAATRPLGTRFQATGLPEGLTLDPLSGDVSGTLSQHAAGLHTVQIVARTDTRVERVTFSWLVIEGTLPTVASPGVLHGKAGDMVELAVEAFDLDGDPLTLRAAGLPRGLRLDAETGMIKGQLARHDMITTYAVTLTASDGNAMGGTVFTWIVLP